MSRHHRVSDIKYNKLHLNYDNDYEKHQTCKCCPHDNININININNVIGASGTNGGGGGGGGGGGMTGPFGPTATFCLAPQVQVPMNGTLPFTIASPTNTLQPFPVDNAGTYGFQPGYYALTFDSATLNRTVNVQQSSGSPFVFNTIAPNVQLQNNTTSYFFTVTDFSNSQIRITNAGSSFNTGGTNTQPSACLTFIFSNPIDG